ncbi:MAG: RDD family protein [Bacteroidales bacterium]|jgi:uncharacterized RDD family membrane protein YckC|nr:RDD family protein [Bacteroidales bacterium]
MRKKILKNIISVILDFLIILFFFYGLDFLYLGINYYFNYILKINPLFVIFPVIVILYLLLTIVNHGITPGRNFMNFVKKSNQISIGNEKISVWASFFSRFIDWFIIYTLSISIDRFLLNFVFIDTIFIIMFVAPIYYIICYLIRQQTLGNYLFGIKLVLKNDNKSFWKSILVRELSKFGIGYFIPIIIFISLGWKNHYINSLRVLYINLILVLVFYTVKNKMWWDCLAKTMKKQTPIFLKKKLLFGFYLFLFVAMSYLVFVFYNNYNNPEQEKFLGFDIPFKRIEYPNNRNIIPYQQFLEHHKQNPKKYLLNLFEKYDIVILCEAFHPEDTEWDFIYDVVSDKYFIEKIGNIFTEYGCVEDQQKVDSFMKTNFENDTFMYKTTATLMDFDERGNFYYFINKLYKLNQTLPDSFKIKEHFTSMHKDKYFSSCYFDSAYHNHPPLETSMYDKTMAKAVIDWYRDTKEFRKKCLVVTNYRHAFIINSDVQKTKSTNSGGFKDNQAQYIYDTFPEQTTNVMFHSVGLKIGLGFDFCPIQNGKWNRALKNTNYKPIGFDFKDSPFGKDNFDRFPYYKKELPFCYEDIFKGYIFYKPEEDWTYSTPLFAKYAMEEEYKWASTNNLIDTIKAKQWINNSINEGGLNNALIPINLISYAYHFIDLIIWFFWALSACFITIIRMIVRQKKI